MQFHCEEDALVIETDTPQDIGYLAHLGFPVLPIPKDHTPAVVFWDAFSVGVQVCRHSDGDVTIRMTRTADYSPENLCRDHFSIHNFDSVRKILGSMSKSLTDLETKIQGK